MKETFYSNGKLLITSEYLVLDGANALALPTKFGQYLTVESGTPNEIQWASYDDDGSFWFEDAFSFETIRDKTSFENQPVKNMLIAILHEAHVLNPNFLGESLGYTISSRLTFPKFWGLGTSSTLINNIAQWLEIDAYTLLRKTFGGSGYDIACAQNNNPILYRIVAGKPTVKPIVFEPECVSNIYFVYLNQKQNSKNAIASYRSKSHMIENTIPTFDAITDSILRQNDYNSLAALMNQHEKLMGQILELPTVQQALFPDFSGAVKSLGAWGGDFVLVLSREDPVRYFQDKGYEIVLRYAEMIL